MPIWDEQFHVTSAQKYLNGIFFMQDHPPLGKLLIALGEMVVDANGPAEDSYYIDNVSIKQSEGNLSMAGYRLFTAMGGFLIAPLLYIIFLKITRNAEFSFVLSLPAIFDTALTLDLPLAVLEGPLVLFAVISILAFLMVFENSKNGNTGFIWPFILGASISAASMVKLTGSFLLLLAGAIFIFLLKDKKNLLKFTFSVIAGFAIVAIGVWSIHFTLNKNIETSLPNQGLYGASETYRSYIGGNKTLISAFPKAIADSYKYMLLHQNRVLKSKKSLGSYGSMWYTWPLGGKSIHFLRNEIKPDKIISITLQANPAVWWTSSLFILIAICMLFSSYFGKLILKNRFLLGTMVFLYASYMFAISQIDRVMYLHHYLPPLVISFIITGIAADEIRIQAVSKYSKLFFQTAVYALAIAIVLGYSYYSPLTSLTPLSTEQVERKELLGFWELI